MHRQAAATIILLFLLLLTIQYLKFEPSTPVSITLTPVYAQPSEPHHTIYDPSNWRVVTALRLELYITVSYTGYAQSWSLTGQATWQIQTSDGYPIYSITMPLSASGPSAPPNNQAFVALSATVDSATIESLGLYYYPPDYYRIHVTLDSLAFTITFIDTTQTRSPSSRPSATWQFYFYNPYYGY